MEGYVVPSLKEAVDLAMNDYKWRPVRTLLEVTIPKDSVQYTQLQQIGVDDNIIKGACSRGFTGLVSIFLNSGVEANFIVDKSTTSRMLYFAALNGHLSLVKLLLNAGADIDCKMSCGETSLFYAVREGHLEVVRHLISAGADINTCDKYGNTLLDAALHYNTVKEEIVQLLLDSGCDPNKSNSYSPLYLAVMSDNVKCVKMLLDAGANVNGTGTDIPLLQAAWYGNIPVMQLLLDYGADINAKKQYDGTALHRAVLSGNLQTVKFLIEHGSLINSVNVYDIDHEYTPLTLSFKRGEFEIAALLLNGSVDFDLDIHHKLLHRAVRVSAPIHVIEYLLEHGADITEVYYSKTALEHLIPNSSYSSDEKLQIAKLLLIYGSDHYVEDRYGNTLLHWACKMGDVELVKYLIYYGLNVDAKNWRGKKPYDIAREKGHTNIVKAIIHYHCNKYTKF